MDARERQVLEARWRLSEIDDLHALADRLLADGEDADALIRLFALDRDEVVWEGPAVLEELLRDWGGGDLTVDDAVPIAVEDIARQLLAGSIAPADAALTLERINSRTHYRHYPALEPWCELCEELWWGMKSDDRSYLGRTRAEVEQDVYALARQTLS